MEVNILVSANKYSANKKSKDTKKTEMVKNRNYMDVSKNLPKNYETANKAKNNPTNKKYLIELEKEDKKENGLQNRKSIKMETYYDIKADPVQFEDKNKDTNDQSLNEYLIELDKDSKKGYEVKNRNYFDNNGLRMGRNT